MDSNIIFDTAYNFQALADIGIFLIFCLAIYLLFKVWDKLTLKKAKPTVSTVAFIPVNHTGQKTVIDRKSVV